MRFETSTPPTENFSVDAVQHSSLNRAEAPVLMPVLSERYALRGSHFMVCLCCVGVYLLVSYLPLFQSVTWHHVLMGDWILSHRALPQVDPFLPLSDGFRSVPTSWLSDVLMAAIWRGSGMQGLSIALAVVTLAMLILTGRACRLRSGRLRLALLAMAFLIAQHWTQLSVLRPELLGLTCFAALLCLLAQWPDQPERASVRFDHTNRDQPDASSLLNNVAWTPRPSENQLETDGRGVHPTVYQQAVSAFRLIGAPIKVVGLFVLWANLDGSVLVGVAVLALLALGTAWDVALAERSILAALRTPRVQHAVYLAELAGLATLLQPLGFRLWTDIIHGERGSAWTALGGASPLVLTSGSGLAVAAVCLLAAVLLRWSPRRVSAADVLLMLAGLLVTAFNQQMTDWLAPLALWVLLPHVADLIASRSWIAPKCYQPLFVEGEPVPPLAFKYTLLSGLAIWTAFALSPISNPIFGRGPLPLNRLVSKHAPQALTEFLKKSDAPTGLVWLPESWGDWVTFAGPRGLKVSANSQIHLLSERQRSDILQVHRAEGNWTRTLDRYGVELLIIDKPHQPRLLDAALAQGADWTIRHEDDLSLVLNRKNH